MTDAPVAMKVKDQETGAVTASTVASDMPPEIAPGKMFTDTALFLALLFGIFYFILIRPQQKRLKAHEKMLSELKRGSRVVTGGGIVGTVIKLEGDHVAIVEIAPNVKVRVARDTIGEVLEGTAPLAAETANDN